MTTEKQFSEHLADYLRLRDSYTLLMEAELAGVDCILLISEVAGNVAESAAAMDAIIERDKRLREAVETALIKIGGGLCYFTAGAKHQQLKDAQNILQEALK